MILQDKIIVITGGAGLIGQEFVKLVVQNGGIAIIADIDTEHSLSIQDNLRNKLKTQNIEFLQTDITSEDSLNKAVLYLHKKYARIDAVVNNAYPRNSNYGKHFFDVKYDDFIANIGVNLGGYFLTSQIFAKYFKNNNGGNIVNISSIYGVISPKFEIYSNTKMTTPVEYAVMKSGLIHLTKYMAKYFKGMNIRVNSLSPGGILDNQPEPFLQAYKEQCLSVGMLDKSDINGSLLYLLSDMSKYVNGQNIIVDDGFCL